MMLRFVGRRAVARAILLGALGLFIVGTGLHAAEPPAPPAAEGASEASPSPSPSLRPSTGNGPIASVMTPLAADPEYADQVMALGLDEATAAFMARTLSTLEVTDAHTFAVHHAFPNGATGDETYHLVQGSLMSPGDPPTIVFEIVGDELRYQVRYALDPAGLPDDLRAQVLEGLPVLATGTASTTAPAVRLLGLAPLTPTRAVFAAEAPGTVEVVVDGVISQGKSTAIGKFVKYGEKQGFTKTANSYKAFKAGKKVWEAVEANDLIASALDKLKTLRTCAEEPTNPLTQKAYQDDPSERQKVLDELTAAENDIRASTALMFTTMLVGTGSSLVKAAPWLGFITTPANNYVKETNLGLIQEYLRVAEERVVPCHSSFTISGTIAGDPIDTQLSGQTCSLGEPFEVKTTGAFLGTVSFRPSSETGGKWSYKGKVFNAPFKTVGSGSYRVDLAEDRSSGTIDMDGEWTINIPGVADQTRSPRVTLTLSQAPPCGQ